MQITVDGTPVTLNRDPALKLCTGSGPLPTLDTALQLAANLPGLTDLTLLVHYTLGS